MYDRYEMPHHNDANKKARIIYHEAHWSFFLKGAELFFEFRESDKSLKHDLGSI